MTRRNALATLIIMLVLSAAYADIRVFQLSSKLGKDEHQTCLIQARGLPASHDLAESMKGIHILLTLPPAPHAKRVPRKIETILRNLNRSLAAYQKAESHQPLTRSC